MSFALAAWLMAAPVISAQTAASSAIEAASLKPETGEFNGFMGCRRTDPGLFECRQANLKTMIAVAYGLKGYQIKGPAWIGTERYSLSARIQRGASEADVSAGLQALLRERFRMTVHRESEDLPAYELTVGKGGPKLKEVDPAEVAAAAANPGAGPAGGVPSRTGMPPLGAIRVLMGADGSRKEQGKMTISQIANMMTAQLGRPVIDSTGLKGTYEVELSYAVDEFDPTQAQLRSALASDSRITSPLPTADASTRMPNLVQAVKNDLGLEVTAKRLPTEVLTVDQADKVPVEN